jgi:hypothetical protein
MFEPPDIILANVLRFCEKGIKWMLCLMTFWMDVRGPFQSVQHDFKPRSYVGRDRAPVLGLAGKKSG